MRFPPFTALVLLLSLLPLARAGDDYLFVGDDSRFVSIFQADELQLLGSAEVGSGLREVVCTPACGTFYVLTDEGITVLDSTLAVGKRLDELPSPVSVSISGDFLLVAHGQQLSWIDTATGAIDSTLEVGFAISQVVHANESGLAYLLSADAALVRAVDVGQRALLPGSFPLPSEVGEAVKAADGSRAYVASAGGVLDLARLGASAFAEGGADRAERTDDRAKWLSSVSGDGAVLTDSMKSTSAGDGSKLSAVASESPLDSAISLDGKTVFALFTDGRLTNLDAQTGAETAIAKLPGSPTVLALVADPADQQIFIIKIAGDQSVAEGTDFQLMVDGPTGGLPLTVTPSPNVITCQPALLNGPSTIDCTAGQVVSSVQVTITVGAPGVGTVDFNVLVFPGGLADGLSILSGNMQTLPSDSTVQMLIEYRLSGAPAAGAQLNVLTTPSNATLDCPSPVTTDTFGRVTLNCDVGTVSDLTNATVEVNDGGSNMVLFSHSILPPTGDAGLTKVTADPLSILEGRSLSLVVEALAGSAPQPDVTLFSTAGTGLSCDANATTNSLGRATFDCDAGEVLNTVVSSVSITDGSRTVVFVVTVVDISAGDGITKLSGDNQFVQQNSTFPLPLLVVARQAGQPQVGLRLDVAVNPPEHATCFTPAFTDAAGVGSISCSAQSVTGQTNVTINITDDGGRSIASPFVVTISPLAPGQASTLQLLSSTVINGRAGLSLEDAIQVRAQDDDGGPVPGVPVFASSNDPGVAFFSNPAITNGSGRASFTVIFDCPQAEGLIDIGLSGNPLIAQVQYRIEPGGAVSLSVVQGDNQLLSPGQRTPLALVVEAVDLCGQTIAGVPVAWSVEPPGSGELEITIPRTDSRGRSSTLVRASQAATGDFAVVARSGALAPAAFAVRVTNVPSNVTALRGDRQEVAADQIAALPLVVRVTNAAGQGVAGINVRFSASPGQATFSPINALTNANGDAMTMVRAGPNLGEVVVNAEAEGITVSFTLIVVGRVPSVTVQSFVNGASFLLGLTPGSTGTVFGVGIADGINGVVVAPFPFPTEINGIKVLINGIAAPILAVSNVNGQEQVNFQVPFVIAVGTATVELFNNGSSTIVEGVPITALQPGVFEVFINGERLAAALHADFTLVTRENPARPGEVILLFVTGLGPTDQPLQANVPGPSAPLAKVNADVAVSIDGAEVVNLGAYYAPGLVSAYQVNFVLSVDTQSGLVRLVLRAGTTASQTVFLPVQR